MVMAPPGATEKRLAGWGGWPGNSSVWGRKGGKALLCGGGGGVGGLGTVQGTDLAAFLLPKHGWWRIACGLTLEGHAVARGDALVMGPGDKLGGHWYRGETERKGGVAYLQACWGAPKGSPLTAHDEGA